MPMLQKILVATDLSEASRTPLGYAAALSRRLDASLTALYVSPRYASYEPFPAFPSQAALDPARRQGLEDEVRRFVESAAGPQPVQVVVRDGDPADEILPPPPNPPSTWWCSGRTAGEASSAGASAR